MWLLSIIEAISPLVAVGGGAVVALYIHWRRRKDARAKMAGSRADAHKELWYALRQMEVQAKRPGRSGKTPTHEMENPYDINWLRDHFRMNAALLSPKLHDEYLSLLKIDIRTVFDDDWRFNATYGPSQTAIEGKITKRMIMSANFTKMQNIAKEEWLKWESAYKKMGGFGSQPV